MSPDNANQIGERRGEFSSVGLGGIWRDKVDVEEVLPDLFAGQGVWRLWVGRRVLNPVLRRHACQVSLARLG